MKFLRFLFLAFLFACCLFTFPVTALSEGGYQFVTKWGNDCPTNCILRFAYGVATDLSGNVYVTDYVGNIVRKYASDGTLVTIWGSEGSGDGQFDYPRGIAVDSSGNVYVADTMNNRIQKFTSTGTFVAKWGSPGTGDGQFAGPYGIAIDSSGNIYVADTYIGRIQKFTSTGTFVTKWGSEGSGDGQFLNPQGIAVDSSGNVYVMDDYNRVQKFTSTGAFITKWGSSGTGDGQFYGPNSPGGLAADASGNIYVADTYIGRIQKFTSTGTFVTKWGSDGSGDGQFQDPHGIAVDSAGNIYVADSLNNRIQKFTSNGSFITKWDSLIDGQFTSPLAAAIDALGNIYVADTNRVQKFTSTGGFVTKWGSYGTGDGQFNGVSGIAVDASGNVYVADRNRVQKFMSTGGFVTKWGSYGTGDGQFNGPCSIAADASGTVYVADTYNNRIQRFTSTGSLVTQWGSYGTGDGQFGDPQGIAVDASGNVYVADTNNRRIQKFTSAGTFVTKWGSYGTGDGQFGNPHGIAVDASGNVYVADTADIYHNRIQKFTSTGSFITKWGSQGAGDGQFSYPYGVAVDASGNVYVADTGNYRIQEFAVAPFLLYFPHVATSIPWQTEIAIINTSDQTVTGTLRGLSDKGQPVDTKPVTLSARGRRQITVADEFTNHTDIGYIVFETTSNAIQGYTKVYRTGYYRAAIPAVKEVNDSDIYVSHIASNALWWTVISLVNTTSETKDLTITFNSNGQSVPYPYTLNANEHKAFDIAQEFFNNQPRPDIQSAVISNADGIIGLELFGNIGGSDHLDGILLTDKTASILYYPHVASNDLWWTGIVAYNPPAAPCPITITPYSAQGALLPPKTLSIAGKGKYVGLFSALGLPAQTAWFRIDAPRPLTGFELFGTVNGNQLAAYAGGVGTGAKEGVFAKIEKDGWTGIAFVNTEADAASVTLTAYNDTGTAVAARVLAVDSYAKVVNLAEAIFSQDISGATYIAYLSDRNVVGFQLNGTSDGMMLDGLPALGSNN